MNQPIHFARTPLPANLEQHLKDIEAEILVDALQAHGWNRTQAGMVMGLSLRQMRYRMVALGITRASHGGAVNSHPI
jgi:two-component system response regulator PilR (NtrC family)